MGYFHYECALGWFHSDAPLFLIKSSNFLAFQYQQHVVVRGFVRDLFVLL